MTQRMTNKYSRAEEGTCRGRKDGGKKRTNIVANSDDDLCATVDVYE